jgi:hypothetical protein
MPGKPSWVSPKGLSYCSPSRLTLVRFTTRIVKRILLREPNHTSSSNFTRLIISLLDRFANTSKVETSLVLQQRTQQRSSPRTSSRNSLSFANDPRTILRCAKSFDLCIFTHLSFLTLFIHLATFVGRAKMEYQNLDGFYFEKKIS